MAGLVADRSARCCLMHMLGDPRTMQDSPRYADVVDDVKAFLTDRAEFAVREGIREDRIDVDPGIGFGKTLEHNLELLARTDEIVTLGFRVVIGVSRKSFIHKLADVPDPHDRVPGTIAANVIALERGARVFRVHDVAQASPGAEGRECYVPARWRLTRNQTTSSSPTTSKTTPTSRTGSTRPR